LQRLNAKSNLLLLQRPIQSLSVELSQQRNVWQRRFSIRTGAMDVRFVRWVSGQEHNQLLVLQQHLSNLSPARKLTDKRMINILGEQDEHFCRIND